jgi:hypothetical protein
MSNTSRVIVIAISALIAFGLPLMPAGLAQGVQIAREGSSLALTYTKTLSTEVTVEQGNDLVSWTAAQTRDSLIANGSLTETIKSTVAIGAAKQLFFRLRVTNAWTVALAWDASADPSVTGYRLHYGTVRRSYTRHIDVGNVTAATVSLPLSAPVCYFVVTAYNSAGLESLPSKELTVYMRPPIEGYE